MYRLIVETLLGLQLEVDHLRIAPCIPAHWMAYTVHYRYRETVYHINLKRVAERLEQGMRVTVDGVVIQAAGVESTGRVQGIIPLVDDRQEHHVEVELG
jgi:cellobiose phosphorylase